MLVSTVVPFVWLRKHLILKDLLVLNQAPISILGVCYHRQRTGSISRPQQSPSHGFLKSCGLVQDFSRLLRHPLHPWKALKSMGCLTNIALWEVGPDLALCHLAVLLFPCSAIFRYSQATLTRSSLHVPLLCKLEIWSHLSFVFSISPKGQGRVSHFPSQTPIITKLGRPGMWFSLSFTHPCLLLTATFPGMREKSFLLISHCWIDLH